MNGAERYLRLADANVSLQRQSDTQRLQDLRARGFRLHKAESHGVNNCLIDSLLLALTAQNLTPCGVKFCAVKASNNASIRQLLTPCDLARPSCPGMTTALCPVCHKKNLALSNLLRAMAPQRKHKHA